MTCAVGNVPPRSFDSLSVEALLLYPFERIEDELRRACNELVQGEAAIPQGIALEAKRIWTLMRDLERADEAGDDSLGKVKELAQAWSLLLSRVQAQALDRAGVPHPAIMIPSTDDQRDFWHRFATGVEFLPESDLEEDLLAALSEEWTAVATIGEALRALISLNASYTPHSKTSIAVAVLGPSTTLEYQRGVEDLHHKLLACLLGLDNTSALRPSVHLTFCGLET